VEFLELSGGRLVRGYSLQCGRKIGNLEADLRISERVEGKRFPDLRRGVGGTLINRRRQNDRAAGVFWDALVHSLKTLTEGRERKDWLQVFSF